MRFPCRDHGSTVSTEVALSGLRACEALGAWPDAALWELAALAQVTNYSRGTLLHRRGDSRTRLFVVMHGALEFSRVLPDGRTYVLPYLPPGEPWGLAPILADRPAMFDVRTRVETTLVHVSRDNLKYFLQGHPELQTALVSTLSRRYCQLYEQLEAVSTLPLRQRLARVVLQLAESFGIDEEGGTRLSLRVSQEDLAALTAASRQRVNVEFKQFATEGILTSSYGSITVADMSRLRQKSLPDPNFLQSSLERSGTSRSQLRHVSDEVCRHTGIDSRT